MLPEVQQYLTMIEDLRGQVRAVIAELSPKALNWRPLDGDDHAVNSLAVLAAHVAGAEHFWVAEVIGGDEATRVREAEFATETSDASELVERLDKVGVRTREVLSNLSEEDLSGSREVRGKAVPVRWGILHVIDHTSLHLGHMQITYQLWASGQAGESPRWFERVKG